MLKYEKKEGSLELNLRLRSQNKRKLLKAFVIAAFCHLLFFALFFPKIEPESFKPLSPPIIAYAEEPPPLEDP